MNIHIQDPKVSLENFDFIVAPEHDGLIGSNVLQSKGAIHYLRDNELNEKDFTDEFLKVDYKDYYFSNVIARSSKTMLECNNAKVDLKKTGTEG